MRRNRRCCFGIAAVGCAVGLIIGLIIPSPVLIFLMAVVIIALGVLSFKC